MNKLQCYINHSFSNKNDDLYVVHCVHSCVHSCVHYVHTPLCSYTFMFISITASLIKIMTFMLILHPAIYSLAKNVGSGTMQKSRSVFSLKAAISYAMGVHYD